MGIRHYQAAVLLPTGDPYLSYTMVHNTSANVGKSTQTANDWAELVAWIRTTCAKGDATTCRRRPCSLLLLVIKPDRFKSMTALLKPSVQNTRDSADAIHGPRKRQCRCYTWTEE